MRLYHQLVHRDGSSPLPEAVVAVTIAVLDTAVPYTDTASANAKLPVFLSVTLIPLNAVSVTVKANKELAHAPVLEITPAELAEPPVVVP